METSKPIPNAIQLEHFLNSHGVDTSGWGTGKYKSITLLLHEIEMGEADVVLSENGEILRILKSVTVNVHYSESGQVFRLIEDRQVFPDGTERRRRYLDGSVAGKIQRNEKPVDAARRELEEELGIRCTSDIVPEGEREATRTSESFPGLNTRYILSIFRTDLTKEQFNPEGYVEEQDHITTFFTWEKVN